MRKNREERERFRESQELFGKLMPRHFLSFSFRKPTTSTGCSSSDQPEDSLGRERKPGSSNALQDRNLAASSNRTSLHHASTDVSVGTAPNCATSKGKTTFASACADIHLAAQEEATIPAEPKPAAETIHTAATGTKTAPATPATVDRVYSMLSFFVVADLAPFRRFYGGLEAFPCPHGRARTPCSPHIDQI